MGSFNLTGLMPETYYTTTVRAIDAGGNEIIAKSAGFTTLAETGPEPLLPPGNVMASVTDGNTVTITWDAVDGANCYRLLICDASGDLILQYPLPLTGTSTTLTMSQDGTYTFRLIAVSGAWCSGGTTGTFSNQSDPSNAVVVDVPAGTLPAPASVALVYDEATEFMTATWSIVPGAESYRISVNGGPLEDLGNVLVRTWGGSGYAPGDYSVQIFAVDSGGANGDPGQSNTVNIEAAVPLLGPPQVSLALNESDPERSINATFTEVTGAAGYTIRYMLNGVIQPLEEQSSAGTYVLASGTAGQEFQVEVATRNTEGELGNYSTYQTIQTLRIPTGLNASLDPTNPQGSVDLDWTSFSENDGYVVYLRPAGGTANELDSVIISSYNASGLQAEQTYFFSVAATYGGYETARSSEVSITTTATAISDPPTVTTGTATNITEEEMNFVGTVVSAGGASVGARGFIYALTDSDLEIGGTGVNSIGVGFGLGSYSATAENLDPGTTYYFRAWASNANGIGYGGIQSAETQTPAANVPIVQTISSGDITGICASLEGNVLSNGGASLQGMGIVYSGTDTTPTWDDSYRANVTPVGLGQMFALVSSLTPNTTYHFRAFARNSAGVGYGEVMTFATLDQTIAEFGNANTANAYSVNSGDYGNSDVHQDNTPEISCGLGSPSARGFVFISGVTIPQGVTVTDARIKFEHPHFDGDGYGCFRFVAEDNHATPVTTLAEFEALPKTLGFYLLLPDMPQQTQITGNMSAVLQEVISRPGWVSGNTLCLIIEPDCTYSANWRKDFDHRFKLTVSYES